MNEINNPLKELQKSIENVKTTTMKAFENKIDEAKETIKIKCNNEDLAGKKHPETGVPFVKKTFWINGQKYEGVFPVFKSEFTTHLPQELYKASDLDQFKYCNQQLQKRIERDPEFAKKFNSKQLEQIKNGEPRISGLTWHHNESKGVIQLVDSNTHSRTSHTGGKAIWGGGQACR